MAKPTPPDGWTVVTKQATQFEFRCPLGEACGKNQRLLYKKKTHEEAVEAGAYHLIDKQKHETMHFTWEEALDKAAEKVRSAEKKNEKQKRIAREGTNIVTG